MGQILPFTQDFAFEPEITAAMAAAFDRVCHTIGDHTQIDLVRVIVAKRIVELACCGSSEEEHFYQGALRALGLERQACGLSFEEGR